MDKNFHGFTKNKRKSMEFKVLVAFLNTLNWKISSSYIVMKLFHKIKILIDF